MLYRRIQESYDDLHIPEEPLNMLYAQIHSGWLMVTIAMHRKSVSDAPETRAAEYLLKAQTALILKATEIHQLIFFML